MNLICFYVTEKDIELGVRGDPASCPAILALKRVEKRRGVGLRHKDTPLRMLDFAKAFDSGVRVYPRALWLDLDVLVPVEEDAWTFRRDLTKPPVQRFVRLKNST